MRKGWSLLVRLCLVAALALVVLPGSTSPTPVELQEQADMSQWRAGNIISDAIFFNGGTWADNDVAYFLQTKNPNCVTAPDGTPCLKNFVESTPNRAADAYCGSYAGATRESAASIITKVGRACGVNQRVLLVILQKEQGLVTGSGSSLNGRNYPWERFEKAMGFKCPDTAPCDPTYAGFFNQVYYAARQYKVYAGNVGSYGHKAGQYNNVRFHPNVACGTSSVYIENQATAGLYNYTPYQPNAAALAANRGTGDACSAYGNRNFYGYFTDWFGSTHSLGADRITEAHIAIGGNYGWIGSPTSLATCGMVRDGCGQQFQNGSIYWSPATGAHPTSGSIRNLWIAMGWERGPLGYASSELRCGLVRDGCDQFFEGGLVIGSPATGTRMTNGAIAAAWMAAGRESGTLGYPNTDMGCGMVQSGCGQQFEGGSVYWTPGTGAHGVTGPIRDHWIAQGWERGPLGYATSDMVCVSGGASCRQDFQGETVTWSSATGAQTTSGTIRNVWVAGGAGAGPLGNPAAAMVCGLAGGGCKQEFEEGTLYASASGVHAVAEPIAGAWAALGAEGGSLGYPSGAMVCAADGSSCRQDFRGQTLAWGSSSGAETTSGAIRNVWVAGGAGEGPLGNPTAAMVCGLAAGGCKQEFEDGTVYASAATGTRAVSGPVEAAWAAAGAESGPLGYPSTDQGCGMVRGGCGQQFERGSVYWSPASGAHPTSGAIRNLWMGMGWERGPLGYATTDIRCGLAQDGCDQSFEGGIVTWSTTTGTRLTNGAIGARWVAEGREAGYLGYPSTDMGCGMVRSGCGQQFQNGSIYWSPATGAQATSGAIRTYWMNQGWERGVLGYPAGAMTCAEADGGCRQQFEGGTLTWSPLTGRVTKS